MSIVLWLKVNAARLSDRNMSLTRTLKTRFDQLIEESAWNKKKTVHTVLNGPLQHLNNNDTQCLIGGNNPLLYVVQNTPTK